MTSNTHIHLPPNFSAFRTVEEAVRAAAEEGVRLLGASNYYDYSVYREFSRLGREAGLAVLFGMEIVARDARLAEAGIRVNDPGNPGKIYLCGKGIDPRAAGEPEAARLLAKIRGIDSERMRAMVARVEEVFAAAGHATGLTEAKVVDMVVARHGCLRDTVYLQERHVAQAFQEALFRALPEGGRGAALEAILGAPAKAPDSPSAVQNDIRSRLMKAGRPAFVEERFVSLDEARALVSAMHGIACYPVLADSAIPACEFETPVEALIGRLQAWDVRAVEFIAVRNSPEALEAYVPALRDAGFCVTCGTEHNTLDALPIAPTCVGGAPIPGRVAAIFEEGACVLAAHQAAVERGEPGFPADPDIERWAAAGRDLLGA